MRQQLKQLTPLAVSPRTEPEFRRLLDKLPGGAYTCDADGLITYFNQRAVELWGRAPKLNDPEDRYCGSFKLFSRQGRPISHEECWMALTLKNDKAYVGHEIVVQRPCGQRLTVLAHANPIHDDAGSLVGSVNVLVDITAQKDVEESVHKVNVSLSERVAESSGALNVLRDIAVAANEAESVEEALEVALERVCDYNGWLVGHAWQRVTTGNGSADELVSSRVWYFDTCNHEILRSLEVFRRKTEAIRIPLQGGFVGRVARTAEPYWYEDVAEFTDWRRGSPAGFGLKSTIAFPVRVREHTVAVLEFFSDGFIEREQRFMETMADAGIQLGRVFERKQLQRAIADATTEQQQRIARELHDSVSQLLTGVGMAGESLRQALGSEASPHAELAAKLVRWIGEAQQQVRHVSRGLMPVEADASGLLNALRELTERSLDLYTIPCTLECPEPVLVHDNVTASQLYFIASEALHNAVKHAGATGITIRLENVDDAIRLTIADDGSGIDVEGASTGMGQSIMQYRAGVIDAKLFIDSDPSTGTSVICTVPINACDERSET